MAAMIRGHGRPAHEKDLTLAAAKTLKARLERTGRFKIVLTRSSDVFVPLEKRVQIARAANADLFISLHADAGGDPAVRGATVYTLSDQGVDRAAKDATDSGSFLDVKLPGHDQSVQQILLDLTQRTTRNRSGAFAEILLDNVGRQTDLVSRSHRDAGYVVLLAPDVPAVLLEMGFITNHRGRSGPDGSRAPRPADGLRWPRRSRPIFPTAPNSPSAESGDAAYLRGRDGGLFLGAGK